tara:strand:+ start:518 stop:883 length:366 start_codon:yes stop_codon:yes gene_type:complete
MEKNNKPMDLRSKDAIESSKQHDIDMGNILIAEFMQKGSEGFGLYDYNGKHYKLYELKYHTDWNWLMPVVDKIKSISGKLPTHIGNIPNDEDWESNNFLSTNIEETYRAVIEFIKDYNQNN